MSGRGQLKSHPLLEKCERRNTFFFDEGKSSFLGGGGGWRLPPGERGGVEGVPLSGPIKGSSVREASRNVDARYTLIINARLSLIRGSSCHVQKGKREQTADYCNYGEGLEGFQRRERGVFPFWYTLF